MIVVEDCVRIALRNWTGLLPSEEHRSITCSSKEGRNNNKKEKVESLKLAKESKRQSDVTAGRIRPSMVRFCARQVM